ncbi:MAG TPA: hypothetical protein DCM62_06180 [Bacteroidales bacterium]|nr:hypothetical protein [Bacteroidales bacterium]
MLALSKGSTERSRSVGAKHLYTTIKSDPSLRSGLQDRSTSFGGITNSAQQWRFFHGLDFCSTFDQAKVERKIKRLIGVELQIPPSEGIRCHAERSEASLYHHKIRSFPSGRITRKEYQFDGITNSANCMLHFTPKSF